MFSVFFVSFAILSSANATEEGAVNPADQSECVRLFNMQEPSGVDEILSRSSQQMTLNGEFPHFDFTTPDKIAENSANLLERRQSPYIGLHLIGHKINYTHSEVTYKARVLDLTWNEDRVPILQLRLISSEPQKPEVEGGLQPGDNYTLALSGITQSGQVPQLQINNALFFLEQDEDLRPAERRRIPLPSTDEESTGIAMQRVAIANQISKNATEMSLEQARNSHMRLRFINHLNRGEWGWIESRLKSAIGYPWTIINRLRQAKYDLAKATNETEVNEAQGAVDALLSSLARRLDKYIVNYELVREILADPSYTVQQKNQLKRILESMAYEFHSIPPTHQEMLSHASDLKVEMARLEHYKKLEEQLFRNRVGAYVLNVINMQDPPKQIPENIGRFYKLFRKNAVDNFHLSVVLFKLVQVRQLATFDDDYHDYLMSEVFTQNMDMETEEEEGNAKPSSRRPGRTEKPAGADADVASVPLAASSPETSAEDKARKLREFQMLDQMLYDIVFSLAFEYENHPLVALYRVAGSDRVINAVVKKMEKIASTRSEGAVAKLEAAEKAADELGPLPLEYSGSALWFKITTLKERVGNYFTAPRIGKWSAYGALLAGGLIAKWYTGFSFQDFAVDAGAFLGVGADAVGGWLGVGLEDAGASPEIIEQAVDAAEKAMEDGTLDECLTPDGDICPGPDQELNPDHRAG